MGTSTVARTHLVLLLVLTFSTGIVDAVGYLGLDRVFAGNMTGNVVILGLGLAGADDLPVLGPGVGLAAFALGAVLGGRVLRRAPPGVWTVRTTVLLGGAGLVLAATAVALLAVEVPVRRPLDLLATAALAVAMGTQAATARGLGVADVTTVVVTSTLTGLASDLGAGRTDRWPRRLVALAALVAGAAAGALLLALHPGWGTLAAAVITLAVAGTGHRLARDRDDGVQDRRGRGPT